MSTPPRLAERLLRWSLPEEDRDVVLGDLYEELVAIAEEAGAAPARRWYWQQTVLSLGPNLARRVQRWRDRRARFETEQARQARAKARRWGFVMLLVGAPGLFWTDGAFEAAVSVNLALFGATTVLGSLFPWRVSDEFDRGIARRRSNIYWTLFCLAVFPARVFGRTPFVDHFQMTALVLAGSFLLWPKKYWVFGSDALRVEAQVRTPFIGTHRARDGSLCLTVDAPSSRVSIGDPIVARADDPRIGINRVYSSRDSLRVFAVVGEGAEPPRATLDVLDASGVVRMSSAARLQPVDLVPAKALVHPPTVPLAQIDESINLTGLPPGRYQLRVAVADETRRAEKFADFQIEPVRV